MLTVYNYSRGGRPMDFPAGAVVGEQQAVLGKVLGLLGFACVFTAGGALIGLSLGPGAFLISIIGSFATLIALNFLREKAPINLALLYGFATFEGMALGLILESYISRGLGGAVVNAAVSTAAVTLAAGAYGYTTKRDLTGLGGILFIGLIGVIVASVVGIFIQLPLLYIGISAVAALLFTGFLVFDLNRVAQARGASDGMAIMLAVSVYLDVLNLFLALLRLFGMGGSSNNRD